jgi:putative peptidoglycan lipid II flippase
MNMTITFVKVVLASAVMGMAAKGVYNFILPQAGSNFALLAAVLAGGLIYSVVIYFMRIREVQVLAGAVKERLGSYF